MQNSKKLVARPLIKLEKPRRVTPLVHDGIVYLMLTKKRFIGKGSTLEAAIENANLSTFYTGYMVEEVA